MPDRPPAAPTCPFHTVSDAGCRSPQFPALSATPHFHERTTPAADRRFAAVAPDIPDLPSSACEFRSPTLSPPHPAPLPWISRLRAIVPTAPASLPPRAL